MRHMTAGRLFSAVLALTLACNAAGAQATETVSENSVTEADVSGLINNARAEIRRLRAILTTEESRLAEERRQAERALQSDETVEALNVQIGLARRYLPEHPVVVTMGNACQDAFDQLDLPPAREFATNCAREVQPIRQVPVLYPCSRLQLGPSGAGLGLTGYVSSDENLESLVQQYGETFVRGVTVRPWPVCKALETLELPTTMTSTPNIALLSRQNTVALGESLAFEVITPDVPSFLYLYYLQADDTVVNLQPRRGAFRPQYGPREKLRFGDGLQGRQTYTASPPVGPEAIVAIATRSPLDLLDELESPSDGQYRNDDGTLFSRAQFLENLDAAIADVPAKAKGRREIASKVLYVRIIER